MTKKSSGRRILSVETLHIIKEATQAGKAISLNAIASELVSRDRRFSFYLPEDDKKSNGYLRRMLGEFQLLGLVQSFENIDSREETWAVTRWNETSFEDNIGEKLPISESGGGGARNGDLVVQDGGGDDGNGSGAGYREVLSHPNLFSLPSDEFEVLLAQIGE